MYLARVWNTLPRGVGNEGVDTDRKRLTNRAGPVGLALALMLAALVAPLAAAAPRTVVFGAPFTLSGDVPSHAAGESVRIFSRTYTQAKFGRIATLKTRANGRWTFVVRPLVRTTYLAVWGGTTSSPLEVRVQPFLDLDLKQSVLSVRARAVRSLAGRSVVVQLRRPGGAWRNVRTLELDGSGRAEAPLSPPLGLSELRLYMSAKQAGPGYDSGYSAILEFRNRA